MQEYADTIDIAISEKDTGIYNAMNKGVKVAHGDFLLFLNSGDWLNSTDVTEVILPHLTDEIDILSGYVLIDGTFKRHSSGSPKALTISSILHDAMSHQGTFIRKSLLINRPYNERYRIISDWVFFFETSIFDSPRYQHIDFDIAVFERYGLSSNETGIKREGKLYWPTILSKHAIRDISSIHPELFIIFRQIPDSYKFQNFCARLIKILFSIYSVLRPKAIHKCDNPCIYIDRIKGKKAETIRFTNPE